LIKGWQMDFPRTVDEITPEWMTKVLRATNGAILDATVESFSAEGLDGGIIGDVNRLVLVYSSGSGAEPETVVAKLAINDDELRGRRAGLYEREVKFYDLINSRVGLPTPALYCTEHDKIRIFHSFVGRFMAISVNRSDG